MFLFCFSLIFHALTARFMLSIITTITLDAEQLDWQYNFVAECNRCLLSRLTALELFLARVTRIYGFSVLFFVKYGKSVVFKKKKTIEFSNKILKFYAERRIKYNNNEQIFELWKSILMILVQM